MKEKEPKTRQCDFVYDTFHHRFKGSGWYVVGRIVDVLGEEVKPYKPFHGPFKADDAEVAMKEFFNDIGRPLYFDYGIIKLTSKGKVSNRQDVP